MHITEAIEHARRKSGITVNALAKRAEMPQPDLWRLFKKRLDIRFSTLHRLAKGLGVRASTIVRNSEIDERAE